MVGYPMEPLIMQTCHICKGPIGAGFGTCSEACKQELFKRLEGCKLPPAGAWVNPAFVPGSWHSEVPGFRQR